MPLTIPDSLLEQARLTEQDAKTEIACRLFQAHRLSLWQAAQWALSRVEMEVELRRRSIPFYEVTEEQISARTCRHGSSGDPGMRRLVGELGFFIADSLRHYILDQAGEGSLDA